MALQYQRVKEELESKYADNRGLYTKGKKDIIDIRRNYICLFDYLFISS